MDRSATVRFELPAGTHKAAEIRKAVDKQINDLAPGEHVIYHAGFLLRDRRVFRDLDVVAQRFFEHGTPPDFEHALGHFTEGTGRGRLVQRRIGSADYRYLFVKNHRIQRSTVWG